MASIPKPHIYSSNWLLENLKIKSKFNKEILYVDTEVLVYYYIYVDKFRAIYHRLPSIIIRIHLVYILQTPLQRFIYMNNTKDIYKTCEFVMYINSCFLLHLQILYIIIIIMHHHHHQVKLYIYIYINVM